MKKWLIIILILLLGIYSPGCSRQDQTVAPGDTPQSKGMETINVICYYVKYTPDDAYLVRESHKIPYTREVVTAALRELITSPPQTGGAVNILPADTKILGIEVVNGQATVNFSPEVLKASVGSEGEILGIQSIVNTLTEFPEISTVSFSINGKTDQRAKDWWGHVGLYDQPFSRKMEKVYEPAIWVTHPVPEQLAGVPLLVKGSARVFEAAVSARLLDASGKVLATGCATAAKAAPERGDFEMSLSYKPPVKSQGRLEVYWSSPKDGRDLDKVTIPVLWP